MKGTSKVHILAKIVACFCISVFIAGIFHSMGYTEGLQDGIAIGHEHGVDIGKLELLKEQAEAAKERQRIVEIVKEVTGS